MTSYSRGSCGAMVCRIQKALHLKADGIYGSLTEEAVREFQRSRHLKADGVAGPATLALLLPAMRRRSSRRITAIIVHCSATPEGRDYTVADIRRWHLERGFSDIGYHYVIYRNGSVHEGRDIDVAGAHCEGHNTHSIGICYIGGVAADGRTAKDTRTDAQKEALLTLLQELRADYPGAAIHGHRDFAAKDCPSFNATHEYRSL